jgi:hypothetical protein
MLFQVSSNNTSQFLLTLLIIAVVTGIALVVKIQYLRAINEKLLAENQQLDAIASEQTNVRRTSIILEGN